MKSVKKILAIGLSGLLALSLAACSQDANAANSNGDASEASRAVESAPEGEATVVKIGIVGEVSDQWDIVIANLAEEGIDVQLVKFADYSLPNRALADGEIDLNSFQHYAFFNNDITEKSLDLTAIGETIIAPLGLYSAKIDSLDDIKEGDLIAIPNDATNGGRSLRVLEAAGLITVDPEAGYTPTRSDITGNPLNLDFIEVEAAQTAALLPDVAAAIINGGHAVDNGFVPAEDSIYLEQPGSGDNPYVNIIAARTEDANNETYLRVVEAYQTDEVAGYLEDNFKGSYLPAWK